ncbi:MAG: Npt1/Npt2 family nucleotide transporter [Saprospiraceae bacterium]
MNRLLQDFRKFLIEVFDIKDGELGKALLMQSIIFLLIATLLIVKPTVNSLFISKFGVQSLPKAFILVAIFAAVISTFYSRVLLKQSLLKIFLGIQIFSIISLVVFGVLLQLNFLEGWILYLFYVWMAIFGILSASQFWILANIVFNAREAKRLFGFIGSGAIAGGIFGGYLTSVLAELIGSENLLFVAALLLSICIPLTRKTWKKYVLLNQTKYQQKKRLTGFSKHPFQIIRQSKHLSLLAGIIGISVLVAKLVEYQFSAIASEKIPDPDDLTSFFGFWFSNFNLISLIIQLFLTRRIIEKFGVGRSLFFLPGSIGLGALCVVFFPELWAAIFIRLADGSLKQSINKAAIELLALPIPVEIKNQTKTFIDVFIDSAATGLSGIILIFVISGLDLPLEWVSLINLLMVGVWIYFALKVQKEYLNSFKINLGLQQEGQGFLLKSKNADLEQIRTVLKNGSEKEILFVLEQLRAFPHKQLFSETLECLENPNARIRAAAIKTLYFYKNQNSSERISEMTSDPSQLVKIEAFEFLMHHHSGNLKDLMENYWAQKDARVKGAALVSMARESRSNLGLQSIFQLNHKIQTIIKEIGRLEKGSEKKFQTISVLKAIGYGQLSLFYDFLEKSLNSEDPAIVEQAILSAGNTLDKKFLPVLIELLNSKLYKKAAIEAIANYGPGIIQTLKNYNVAEDFQNNHAFKVPQILSYIGDQASVEYLLNLFETSGPKMRVEILKALNKLKQKFPFLSFPRREILSLIHEEANLYHHSLGVIVQNEDKQVTAGSPELFLKLKTILEKRLDENLERIFLLLGLKFVPSEILSLYKNIQCDQEDLRVNALEYLENLLDNNLKKILIPIIESSLLEKISDDILEDMELKIPRLNDSLKQLTQSQDQEVSSLSQQLLLQLEMAS